MQSKCDYPFVDQLEETSVVSNVSLLHGISDPVVLEKEVPGIGRYTAGAIVSHAYNVPAELVDGNVIRVLSRLRAIGGDVKSPKVIDLHW